jgi:hypothetical protein
MKGSTTFRDAAMMMMMMDGNKRSFLSHLLRFVWTVVAQPRAEQCQLEMGWRAWMIFVTESPRRNYTK